MTGVLKDFTFAIAYLDDVIIFNRTAEEHLYYIRHVFEKLQNAYLSMKLSKCHFFTKEILYLEHILSTTSMRSLPLKPQAINNINQPKTAKQVHKFIGLLRYYRKFIKDFINMARPLTLLTHHKAKFEWLLAHHTTFMMLKEAIMQAPILCYPHPASRYIVYMDASDDACGAQL